MIVDDEIYERLKPKQAIREELGGGYYYRCPWLDCGKIVKSEWDYCPLCGTRLVFNDDSYTKTYYHGRG